MYDIQFTSCAKKSLKKLPIQIQERIIEGLRRARIRPHEHFERLVGSTAHKLRVGDYRIIADIFDDKIVILVLDIGHRRNIYKKK